MYASYGRRSVIDGVDLELAPSERVILVGPNGSGKSTLLNVLTGVVPMDRGTITLSGEDFSRCPTDRRVCAGMSYLMQTRNVFLNLTVDENLELAAPWDGEGDSRRALVLDTFPKLRNLINRRAGLLSGGERQALAVGLVLMRKAKVMLMDEPTAGLAPSTAAAMLAAIHAVQEKDEFALLIIEHNIREVAPWASRALVMNHGRILAEERQPVRLLDRSLLERYYFT